MKRLALSLGRTPTTHAHSRPRQTLASSLCSTVLLVLLTGCSPSITERAARDVSRAFADAQFRQVAPYETRSTMQRVAGDPRVRANLRWFSYSLGHSIGRTLGRLLVP